MNWKTNSPAYDLIPTSSDIPKLYAQEKTPTDEQIVYIKLFTPMSGFTWLLTEYRREEKLAFGYTYNASYQGGGEWGYVSIEELESLMTPRGIPIPAVERDLHWTSKPFSQCGREIGQADNDEDDPPLTPTPEPTPPSQSSPNVEASVPEPTYTDPPPIKNMQDYPYKKVDFAKGMSLPVLYLLVDEPLNRLVYIHLADTEQKVRSTKAFLFNGGSKKLKSVHKCNLSIGATADFDLLDRKSSSTGWHELAILNKQTLPEQVGYEMDFTYCISFAEEGLYPHTLVNFYDIISQVLNTPIKAEWADYLWEQAMAHSLIKAIHDHTTIGKVRGYRINHKSDKWQKIIEHGLASKTIVI